MSAPITIEGRLGKDPEMRVSASGKAVTRITVATSRRQKDGDQWVDVDTTWWDVTLFGVTAEDAAEQLVKGDRVVVVGRVRDEHWETKEGEKRSKKAVVADTFGVRKRANRAVTTSTSTPADDPWAAEAPF